MRIQKVSHWQGLVAAGVTIAFASCSSSSSKTVTCASSAICAATAPANGTASATLAVFTPPTDPGPGGVLFAASGEVLALTGYAFPPATADAAAFVDGWDVHFTRLLVTVGGIPKAMTPAEFGKLVADETEKWRKVVEFAGVSVD